MYGDVFMVPVDFTIKPYYPAGTWCTLMYFNPAGDDPRCFKTTGGNQTLGNKFFYAKDGTITPLQDPEGTLHQTKWLSSTADLLTTPVDLHVNPTVFRDPTDPTFLLYASNGQILYYSDYSTLDFHCYVEMVHRNDTITFSLAEGRDISDCADYPGFKIGTIVIYNQIDEPFPFTKLIINGNIDDVIQGRLGGLSKSYMQFDLTMNKSGVKKW